METKELQKGAGSLPVVMAAARSMFFNIQKFEHAQRVARALSSASMVPDHFKGPDNIGNCLIALNYAERIGADVFMTMQNLYVVHGRPGIEGKLVIALVNQCGRFEPLEFDEGDNSCTATAKDIKSGKILRGPTVDLKMVQAEGWDRDKGSQKSKWKTMPQLMYRYRSATYFARTYCPEVLLGMNTVDELEDYLDLERSVDGSYDVAGKTQDRLRALKDRLKPTQASEDPKPQADIPIWHESNWKLLRKGDGERTGLAVWIDKNLGALKRGTYANLAPIIAKYESFYGAACPLEDAITSTSDDQAGEAIPGQGDEFDSVLSDLAYAREINPDLFDGIDIDVVDVASGQKKLDEFNRLLDGEAA